MIVHKLLLTKVQLLNASLSLFIYTVFTSLQKELGYFSLDTMLHRVMLNVSLVRL